MRMSVHLNFSGNCADAFDFYTQVFKSKDTFRMAYVEGPQGMEVPANWMDKIMHASIKIGDSLLMGCDAPPGKSASMSGFQVCVESKDQAEVKRIYDALSAGGSVQMPLAQTFWSPLFGMCTDKFGVGWMVGVPGEGQ